MSRSRRRTPICGMCNAESEKQDKRLNHKRLRAAVRRALVEGSEVMPAEKEVSNTWLMPKDGKMRFDPAEMPHLMRK